MFLAGALLSAVVFAGPPDDVEVQRPGQGPGPAPTGEGAEPMPSDGTEPVPSEGAEATEATDAAPTEPAPAEPAPTGGIVPLGSAEPEPVPATAPGAEGPAEAGGPITSWRDAEPAPADFERPGYRDDPYRPPTYRGTGLFVTGGLAFGTALFKQALSPMFCNGPASINCDSVGWIDRSFAAATIGLIGGGAWKRGEWAATDGGKDVADEVVRKRKIAGWTLAGIGFAGAAIDMSFAIACWGDGKGPYAKIEDDSPFVVKCRSTATGLTLDAATIIASTGMGLGLWANAYARKRAASAGTQARITSIAPMMGRGHWGVGVGGTF